MYKAKLYVPPGIFDNVRDLPARAERQFRRELQTVVKSKVQQVVNRTLGVEPGPVKHPFVWDIDPVKNARIRGAFFATKGFGRGLGAPRTHQLSTSWFVIVGTQFRAMLITIYNNKPYTKYVYRPRQLPGHRLTGWGRDMDRQLIECQRVATTEIGLAWLRAVRFAARSQR